MSSNSRSRDSRSPDFWFPAKKIGWGWGPPCSWQGWLVLGLFAVAISGGSLLFNPVHSPVLFVTNLIVSTTALIVICAIKGEKPGGSRKSTNSPPPAPEEDSSEREEITTSSS